MKNHNIAQKCDLTHQDGVPLSHSEPPVRTRQNRSKRARKSSQKPRPIFQVKCQHCGITFPSKMPWGKFCCTEHRMAHYYEERKPEPVVHKCDWCGTDFPTLRPEARFCGDDCRMAFHYNKRQTTKSVN